MKRLYCHGAARVFWTGLAVLGLCWPALCDERDPFEITDPVEMRPYQLTLVDEESGEPVVGAEVRVYAMRGEEDRGSHYGWPASNAGKPPTLTTDASGRAEFQYPIRFGLPPDWLTTSELSVMVRHPDFIPIEFEVDPVAGEATQQIKAGVEIAFSAIDQDNKPIEELGIWFAGPGASAKWSFRDGMFRSGAIPNGRWQVMLVAPREDGQHLFSGILPVRLAKDRRVNIRDAKLRPGLRLTGQLDAAVPRPVADGKVLAWCLPKPAGRVYVDDNPSLGWMEQVPIAEDGSFVFPSLPRSGKIQLIALCRGWVVQDDKEAFERITMQRRGIMVNLQDFDTQLGQLEVVIPMEETGQIRVVVKQPDGRPLEGATLATWPSQALELAGSQVLGRANPSIESVLVQLGKIEPPDPWAWSREENRYYQKTDANGVGILRDIPLKSSYQVTVGHDDFLAPALGGGEAAGRDRNPSFTLESPEPVEIVVTMEAKLP